MPDYIDFTNQLLKRSGEKKFKATNSITMRQIYRDLVKTKVLHGDLFISEFLFNKIIRGMNLIILNKLLSGHSVKLPHRMGSLEIIKVNKGAKYKNGKLVITYPINWGETLKLWYNDEEARQNKLLIRFQNKEVFKVIYNKRKANYNNKIFMEFLPSRMFKIKIKDKANNREIDGYELYYN